jgi:P-type Mg2+ transporter
LDHFVGALEQSQRNVQAKCFRRFEIDDQLVLIRCLHRHVSRLLALEGATDVARGAADIILLSPDLSLIADGVAEGRRTFANILKYVRMGTSSNFGNMLSMALAPLLLPFLPLLPIQILLNNLLYDFSEIGIPFDYVDARDLEAPRHWDMRGILKFTIVMGSLSTLFDLGVFFLLLKVLKTDPSQFRTVWFAESLLTQILVIFIIRSYHPISSDWPHPILVTSSLLGLVAAIVLLISPLGQVFALYRFSNGASDGDP